MIFSSMKAMFMRQQAGRSYHFHPASLLLFILAAVFVGAIPHQPKNEHDRENAYGDVLMMGTTTDVGPMNPLLAMSGISSMLVDLIFDSLIIIDRNGRVNPHLASSWETDDHDTQWTFHLSPGVTFHDGVPLTAEDVKFTLDLVKSRSDLKRFAYLPQRIKEVKVIDAHTIVLSLTAPSPLLLSISALEDLGILPKHIFQQEDLLKTKWNFSPVGSGPFRFLSLSKEEIRLEAYDGYFPGRSYLDGVIVKLCENKRIVWAKLMNGEIDYHWSLLPTSFEIIQKVPEFSTYAYVNVYYYLLGFNHKNPLFRDPKVRQALNYAVNREQISQKLFMGRAPLCAGTIFPESWAYDSQITPLPHDPGRALDLLKEAGWGERNQDHLLQKEGKAFTFKVYIPAGFDLLEEMALLIREDLLRLGILMDIEKVPVTVLMNKYIYARQFEAFLVHIRAGAEPHERFISWHSSQIKDGSNFPGYENKEVDLLLEAGEQIRDQQKRKQIYTQYQKVMQEDPPGIFLLWSVSFTALHQRFKGAEAGHSMTRSIKSWWVPREEQRYDWKKLQSSLSPDGQ
jgi:peptide/nickel transport system substrate-binding protein